MFDWFQVLFQKKISGLNHPAIVQQDFLTLISTRPGICSYFKTHKAALIPLLSVKRVDSFQNLGETSNQIVFGGPGSS